MASKPLDIKFDFNAWFTELGAQFQGLDPKEPGQWPLAPKVAVGFAVHPDVGHVVQVFIRLAGEIDAQ